MKEKRKSRAVLIIALVLFLAVFIFPRRSSFEQSFLPVGVINLEEQATLPPSLMVQDSLILFENSAYFVYLKEDLSVEKVLAKPGAVAVSPRGYIEYSQVQNDYQSLIWKNPDGGFRKSLNYRGYPWFQCQGNRLFLVNPQSSGIKEIDSDGDILYEFQYPSILTNLTANCEGEAAMGWLDGSINVLDQSGKEIFRFTDSFSRINVNYALVLSESGDYMAAVNGIDTQNLLLFYKRKGEFQRPGILALDSDLRYEMLLKFSLDKKALFIEQSSSLVLVKLKGLKKYNLELNGALLAMAEGLENNLIFTACDLSEQEYTLNVFHKPDRFLGASQSAYRPVDLKVLGGRLYCLFEEYLICYAIKGVLTL
ncbi:MAG: hypothetical protein JXR70_00105 [Spirochaetales bacterium]|nr:hypothetical protein [Spirochaetales bacterium]